MSIDMMNGEEKLNKIDEEEEMNEDDDEFSLSEDVALSTRPNSESSNDASVKKKKKFKPGKFISKHLKIKKDDRKSDSGENSETRSEDSSTKSPKIGLIKRNIAKKFSRKKKSQVGPLDDSGVSSQYDEPLNNERDLKEIEKLSKSDSNISNNLSDSGVLLNEKELSTEKAVESPVTPVIDKNVLLGENKKVQLQITISGKKVEKLQTSATRPTVNDDDRASAPLQSYYKSQNDIVLQTERVLVNSNNNNNKIREEFFSVMVSGSDNDANMPATKSISNDALSQSVTSSPPKQTNLEDYKDVKLQIEEEIEKNPIIRSSTEIIRSSAEDLRNLVLDETNNIENHPELKIVEKSDEDFTDSKEDKVNVKEKIKEFEDLSVNKVEDNGDMKKTKIQVNRSQLSSENSTTSENQSTVHTQEAHKPYHLNLSSSMSIDELKHSKETKPNDIKFEVGSEVRPQKILSANSNNVTPIIITEIESGASNAHESTDDVFHSPKSEPKEKRDSKTRRKIAYIPQLTIYTPEEQELLRSNIIANYESFDTPSLPPDSSMFPVFDDSLVSNMTPTTPEKREYLYKILVIGELGTGKTSFIKRYVHQFFSNNYRATIGVDFALKVLNWDQSTIIRLQLWDIAGQERFGNMTRVYYKEAVGAFIVFDVSRPATFDAVSKWKADLDSKVQLPDGSPIPCILLANKCDQAKQGLVTMPAKMDEYCKQNGFAGWFETSAKENTNIEESSKALVSKILLNDKLIHNDIIDGDRIALTTEDTNKTKKFCSC